MKFPSLTLALQSQANTEKTVKASCLIDTGCTCPLIISNTLSEELGLEVLGEDTQVVVGGGTGLKAKRAKLTMVVHTLEKIYRLPCVALILEENKPVIGTPVLDIICRKTNTRFVMDFQKAIISFE